MPANPPFLTRVRINNISTTTIFNNKEKYLDLLPGIIEACKDKNPVAQRRLVKLFFGYAKSICLRYASHAQEAEEVLNDSFLKVFNNLSKYEPSKPFKPWLQKIVINTAIDRYRQRTKFEHAADIDDLELTDFNSDVIGKITTEEILSLVKTLPESYRIVFSLYVVDGYNHREIAEILNIKEGTSKSALRDARKKLQLMIKTNYPHLYLAYLNKRETNEN